MAALVKVGKTDVKVMRHLSSVQLDSSETFRKTTVSPTLPSSIVLESSILQVMVVASVDYTKQWVEPMAPL